MDKYYLSLEMLVVVGIYSLLWFIVGIRLGQHLPREKPVRPRKNSRDNSNERRHRGDNGNIELYIGNLSYDVTEKEVKKLFREYGDVASVRLINNKFNGKSKGYGFIEMTVRSEAEMAIRKMNNKDIMGRRIIVNEAKTSARS